MPQSFVSPLLRLIITAGATASNRIANFRDSRALAIFAGASAHTNTIKIQVAPVSGGIMRDLTSAGADINIAASDCVLITDIVFEQIRLRTSGATAETASRYFSVSKRWES